MKLNRLFLVVLLGLIAVQSNANVSFRWLSASVGDAKDELGINLATGNLLLTFVSTDNVVDFSSSDPLQTSYGNDVLLSAQDTKVAGKYNTVYQTPGVAGSGAGSYVGNYVYFLIFHSAFASYTSIDAIAAGTYYQVSSMSGPLSQYDTTPLNPQQSFSPGPVQTTLQVVAVPEPSTVGLILVGVGLVALRRMRRA
jgi:hypothetical protein